jgi:hypothetical protein
MTATRLLLLGCALWLCACSKSVTSYPEMTWDKASKPGVPREVRSNMLQELRLPARFRGQVEELSGPRPVCFAAPCDVPPMEGLFLRVDDGGRLPLRAGKVKLNDLEKSRRYVLGGELIYPPERPIEAEIGGNVPDGTTVAWGTTNFALIVDAAQSE